MFNTKSSNKFRLGWPWGDGGDQTDEDTGSTDDDPEPDDDPEEGTDQDPEDRVVRMVNWNSTKSAVVACALIAILATAWPSPVQASQCTFYTVRSTVYLLVTGQAKLLRNGVFVQWVSTGKYTIGPVRRGVSWRCG